MSSTAESALTITFAELKGEIAHKLGYGRTNYTSDSGKVADVTKVLRMGIRNAYVPPPLEGQVHRWSWLKPQTTQALAAGTDDYDLPPNFGGHIEDLSFTTTIDTRPITIVQPSKIEAMRQQGLSGTPQYAGVRVKQNDTTTGSSRWELLLFPKPDAGLILQYRYRVIPEELTDETPYHLGGMEFSEVVLQSCLAAAERFLEDEQGPEHSRFMELMTAAIAHDAGGEQTTAVDVWPISSTSTTLDYHFADLMREMSGAMGFGYDYLSATHPEYGRVESLVNRGYHQFLYSPMKHDWGFLKVGGRRFISTKPDDYNTSTTTSQPDIFQNSTATPATYIAAGDYTSIGLEETFNFWSDSVDTYTTGNYHLALFSSVLGNNSDIVRFTAAPDMIVVGNVGGGLDVAGDHATYLNALENQTTAVIPHIYTTSDYVLEGDILDLEGDITYLDANVGYTNVPLISEQQIREMRQNNLLTTGRPRYAAIRPLPMHNSVEQKWELMIWPDPTGDYEMTYQYKVKPPRLSATNTRPYGSQWFGECLLASCLAVAEIEKTGQQGAHWTRFIQLLQAAIEQDARKNQPEFLGYNRDNSDYIRQDYRHRRYYSERATTVSVNGVLP